ncbi:MAG: hypothetical protein Q7T33_14500 [Dehalococcoidia bacterium]|nr:hypothetical protein [Dehalococcoidia bacterium]
MRKILSIAAGLLVVGLSAVAGFAAFGGDSSASSPTPTGFQNGPPQADAGQAPPAGGVAIAIGQLQEDDGEEATIDLRASTRDGKAGGNFRFFSEEHGYYNGGVRVLSVRDGVIRVAGGGGLFPPEGGRIQVRYEATFSTVDNHAEITVTGPGGYQYTMSGTVAGLVTVQAAPVATPAAGS